MSFPSPHFAGRTGRATGRPLKHSRQTVAVCRPMRSGPMASAHPRLRFLESADGSILLVWLRIRSGPNPAWQYYDVVATTLALQDLDACTNYEVQVQTHCDTGWTVYSSPFFFLTAGCGSGNDMEYCTAKADHSEYEWIAAVGIGKW